MAALAVTTGLESLRVLFNQMKNVYYISTPNQALSAITEADMELPVLEEGVSFDTGAPDVQVIKLTEGRNWVSKAEAGDPDISFQVGSVAGVVNDLFMDNTVTTVGTVGASIGGMTYSGKGYSLKPKKVTGALFMTSEDKTSAIYLPNVEIFANFVAEDGDNPAYFNAVVTPLEDSNGAAIYPLTGTAAAAGAGE